MLYLFTGNSEYLIRAEVKKWVSAFGEKYGGENITQISQLDAQTKATLSSQLTARSLFAQKRLVVISGFPFSADVRFSGASELEEEILRILPEIPEEVLVVFESVHPDKRKKGWKELQKSAEVKNFSTQGDQQVQSILQQKYISSIQLNALEKLVFYKGGDLRKSISEIEKLLITKNPIILTDIKQHVTPEFEQSIFVFIDTLLAKNTKNIFSDLENLIDNSNFYASYQSIIANLRTFLYIFLLKKQGKSSSDISDILKLGNRTFLIQKKFPAKYPEIQRLYLNLLDLDKNMKFGKLISSDEQDLKKNLEKIFLEFIA